jgi:ribosomal protein S14
MQAKTIRNKKIRSEFQRLELTKYIESAIVKNKLIVSQLVPACTTATSFISSNGIKRGNEGSVTRIRNLCTQTGRSRAIIGDYKISRIQLKRLGESGKIGGVRKI